MGFISRLLGREDAARKDAGRIYNAMMTQARRPEFYGEGKVPDNYDGRIDLLTLHLAIIIRALNTHGEQGKRLAQAIYEVMRDDWDVALREEGMSDTGVMKRIKPMIRLFYTRIKAYTEGIDAGSIEDALHNGVMAPPMPSAETDEDAAAKLTKIAHKSFVKPLSDYAIEFASGLSRKNLGEIALTQFELPQPPSAKLKSI